MHDNDKYTVTEEYISSKRRMLVFNVKKEFIEDFKREEHGGSIMWVFTTPKKPKSQPKWLCYYYYYY